MWVSDLTINKREDHQAQKGEKMSLTSFLKNKEVREMSAGDFKKPKRKNSAEMKAAPVTNHYALIGVAFDYLMRFYLKYHYPQAIEKPWVAISGAKTAVTDEEFEAWLFSKEKGAEIIETDSKYLISKRESLPKTVLRCLYYSEEVYESYLSSGVMDDQIIIASIFLAQLDSLFRPLWLDNEIGVVDKSEIQDLKNQIALVNYEDFKPKHYCILNPTFGEGSKLVGGADADLIIDNKLIDIKTTRNLKITPDFFFQIVGYYILERIGGITPRPVKLLDIDEIGFYYSRYGIKIMYKVDEIIDAEALPLFIEKFKGKAQEIFSDFQNVGKMIEKNE